MRLAHLILAHNKPLQLERLIKRLIYQDTDIYIHLDKKSDMGEFKYLSELQNVFFIKSRTKISWGEYSMVLATLSSMDEILKTGNNYSHINLLSGEDYPLKGPAEIQEFLFAHQGKTFMKYILNWKEAVLRVRKYNFGGLNFPLRYKTQIFSNRVLPDRKLPNNLVPHGLSQWLTITPEAARYVIDYLKDNRNLNDFFKITWGTDEMVFQTILLNSALKDTIVNDYLRYIKFPEGAPRPRVLTIHDADDIIKSNKFYARKFDTYVDEEILNYLDNFIDSSIIK